MSLELPGNWWCELDFLLEFSFEWALKVIFMASFRAQVAALNTDCSKKQKVIEEGERLNITTSH